MIERMTGEFVREQKKHCVIMEDGPVKIALLKGCKLPIANHAYVDFVYQSILELNAALTFAGETLEIVVKQLARDVESDSYSYANHFLIELSPSLNTDRFLELTAFELSYYEDFLTGRNATVSAELRKRKAVSKSKILPLHWQSAQKAKA